MTTYVRSIFGLPFMVIYLVDRDAGRGAGRPPHPCRVPLPLRHAAATAQVMGTYLLILLFQRANFAVGTMLTKTDVMQAAIIGSILFSETISPTGWIAILLTVLGVAPDLGRPARARRWRGAALASG